MKSSNENVERLITKEFEDSLIGELLDLMKAQEGKSIDDVFLTVYATGVARGFIAGFDDGFENGRSGHALPCCEGY